MKIVEVNGHKYKQPSESEKAKAKEKMEKLRKEGEKMIKGMFEFIDAQGGWLDFSYRFFPGEPIRTVSIAHGEIVDLPTCVVRHLNNCYKRVRTYAERPVNQSPTDNGGKVTFPTTVHRYSRTRFTPVDVL